MKRNIAYPEDAVIKLKKMFPHNEELARELDANSVRAWEIVHELLKDIGDCHHALSMAGYPYKRD